MVYLPPYLPRAPASKGVTGAAFGEAVSTLRRRSNRAPQGCPQVYGSACARIYCLSALSLRSGLPKPFLGPRSSLRLLPSLRRAPRRWASQPTRAVNSCTVYSVVENSQEVLLLTIKAARKAIWQRLTQNFSNSCNMTTDILMRAREYLCYLSKSLAFNCYEREQFQVAIG